MFFVHRVLINARRIVITAYYRFVYRDRFVYGQHFKFRGNFKLYIEPTGRVEFGDNCFVNNYFSATSIKKIKIAFLARVLRYTTITISTVRRMLEFRFIHRDSQARKFL